MCKFPGRWPSLSFLQEKPVRWTSESHFISAISLARKTEWERKKRIKATVRREILTPWCFSIFLLIGRDGVGNMLRAKKISPSRLDRVLFIDYKIKK